MSKLQPHALLIVVASFLFCSCDTVRHGTTYQIGNTADKIYLPYGTQRILTIDRHRLEYALNTPRQRVALQSVPDRTVPNTSIPDLVLEAERAAKTTFESELATLAPFFNWEHLWIDLPGVERPPQTRKRDFGAPLSPDEIVKRAKAQSADAVLTLEHVSIVISSRRRLLPQTDKSREPDVEFDNEVFLDLGIRVYGGKTGKIIGESNLGVGSSSIDQRPIEEIPFLAGNLALTAAAKNFKRLEKVLQLGPTP